jgi:PAP2 superfamily protein
MAKWFPEFHRNNLEVVMNAAQSETGRRGFFILACLLIQLIATNLSAQSVEPLAGIWKTWVLTSGSQFRLPPPPTDLFATEVTELKMLESQRNAATLDLINYWDAGSPGLRWMEMLYPLGFGAATARPYALLSVAIYDATIAAWDSKYLYNRPRPSQIDLSLTPAIPNPQSPSYPSEHAVVAGAAAEVLAYRSRPRRSFIAIKLKKQRCRVFKPESSIEATLRPVWISGEPLEPRSWSGLEPIVPIRHGQEPYQPVPLAVRDRNRSGLASSRNLAHLGTYFRRSVQTGPPSRLQLRCGEG